MRARIPHDSYHTHSGRRPGSLCWLCRVWYFIRDLAPRSPLAPDGLPILGPLPGVDNLVMATGHGPWGVLWAPITGRVVSELLLDDGEASLNVRAFQPRRFDTLTYRTLMKQRGREKGGERVGEQW